MVAWLTQKDVDDYGHDVLDLAQRAAMHAVTPELHRINDQNESLRRQLAQEQRRGLYRSLDTQVPNWREIDNDLEWRQWLAQPHDLSGAPGNNTSMRPWQGAMPGDARARAPTPAPGRWVASR